MPQRYKLRLGDGSTLSVDIDGLRSWAQDPQAMAQAGGSTQWRPLRDVLVEEENAERLLRALVPPQPKKDEAPQAPEAFAAPFDAPPSYAEPAAYSAPAFGQERGFGEPAFSAPAPFSEPLAFKESPFGEPAGEPAIDGTPATADGSDPAGPPIRLKPLDDDGWVRRPLQDDGGFRSAWADEEEADGAANEEPANEHLQGPLLQMLEPLGRFLSRVLSPLGSIVDRWLERLRRDRQPSSPQAFGPLPDIDVGNRPSLGERLKEAWSGLTARLRRRDEPSEKDFELEAVPEREPEPEPEAPRLTRAPLPPRVFSTPRTVADAPRPAATASASRLGAARAGGASPPKLSEMPVVPLARPLEREPEEDVYEPDEPSEVLGPLWFWTKRLVGYGALVALGVYAYQERDVWFPKAGDVGQTIFAAIDRQAHSRERSERLKQALAEATLKLPHLTPETILLVFGGSPTGILEAPEVFQLAREATERGLDTLQPADAEELRALNQELAAKLSAPERRRLDEYDEARSRRVIFPFENPYAMDLVAKGARALPAARLERFRALTAQAVAAGLKVPAAGPSAAPAQ